MANENNNQAVRSYQPQFKELLQAVYVKKAYFGDFFGGGIQALDGVENNKVAFSLKTTDLPVVIGDKYITDANNTFGDLSAGQNRFGQLHEVIYTDTDVPYGWEWTFREGIDRHTVNNNFDATIADRLDLLAQGKVKLFDDKGGLFVSNNAGKSFDLSATTDNDAILKLFNDLHTYFVNLEVSGALQAWVKPDLYNAIVDHPLNTTAKGSDVDINGNRETSFKGFKIKEVPDGKFQDGEFGYVSVPGIARQFTGINTARSFESQDFDGVELQGAGKAGEFVLPANKLAIVKITVPKP